MATNPARPLTVWEVADRFRAELEARERQAAAEMMRAWQPVRRSLLRETGRLAQAIAERQARGERVPVSWLFGQARLAEWETRVKAELAAWRKSAEPAAAKATREAATLGPQAAMDMVAARAIPFPELAARRLVRFPRDEVAQMVATLQEDSPLAELLGRLGPDTAAVMRETLVRNVALGRGPVVMGRELGEALDGNLRRGLLIARTETMRTFREATRLSYSARSDVVDGWTWWSSRDRRTCVACWAMHGTRHTVQERLDGHPACRCTMIPELSAWRQAEGITGPDIPDGERLFRELPESAQRRILGPARHALYRNGAHLREMVTRPVHPRWGPMRRPANLRQIAEANPQAAAGAARELEALRIARLRQAELEAAAVERAAAERAAQAAAAALETDRPAWRAAFDGLRAEVNARRVEGVGDIGIPRMLEEGLAARDAAGRGIVGPRLLELERLSTQAGELVDRELTRRLAEDGLAPADLAMRERTLVEMSEQNIADGRRMLELKEMGEEAWARRMGFESADAHLRDLMERREDWAAYLATDPWEPFLEPALRDERRALWIAREQRRDAQRALEDSRHSVAREQALAVQEHIAEMLEEAGVRTGGGELLRFRAADAETIEEVHVRRALASSADRLPRSWVERAEAHENPMRVEPNEGGGGFYAFRDGTINVGPDVPLNDRLSRFETVAQHEYMHRVESSNPHVRALEWAFYDRRTRLASGELEEVREQAYSAPGVPAGSSYSYREDRFGRRYTGRLPYGGHNADSAHEVVTTGYESLFAGAVHDDVGLFGGTRRGGGGGLEWVAPDDDFRRFLLGLLFTG